MKDIFDFHTHLAISVKKYCKLLEENNIKKAVVIPYSFGEYDMAKFYDLLKTDEKPKDYINLVLKKLDIINYEFLEQIKEYKNLIPAPWVSPECNNLENIISNKKIKIIKFIPVFDNLTKDYYERIEPIVEESIKNKKIIMIHTGWGAKVKPVGELAEKYSEGKFVIAHMKEDDDFEAIDRKNALINNPNLYCETSYGPGPHRIEQYVKLGLSERLLFGSDFRTSESSLKWYIQQIILANINPEIKQDILFNNAEKLMNI